MPVNTKHPEYTNAFPRWSLVRSIVNNDAKNYILDVDTKDKLRNQRYREDAVLTNFTSLTKTGLTGLVFRRPPEIKLPSKIKYLEDNVTGTGVNIWQFSQYLVGEVLQTGRMGLLVDYPKVEEGLSQAYVEEFGNAARIKPYSAESIINWKTKTIGNRCVLSLVVLCESVLVGEEDIFDQTHVEQYRVLILNSKNVYEQHTYDKDGNLIGFVVPRDSQGNPFNEIPFVFIGSENNDWVVDNQPLYDLAVLNLAHYKNSADLEESSFICGQPYIVVNPGSDPASFNDVNPNGIQYGSRKGLVVGEGGSANLLQANPNQLADQLMKRKEEQAAAIGARVIAPAGGRETAEGARIRFGAQNSALYTLTSNISWGVQRALEFVCYFMDENPAGIEYELNNQFYEETADPNLIIAQMQLFDKKLIPGEEIVKYGQRTGFVTDGESPESLMKKAQSNQVLIEQPGSAAQETTNNNNNTNNPED
jgi:hypothetical protein